MITYKIHLIRHGLTEANQAGRYIGRTDTPVCGEGMEELRTLRDTYEYPVVQKVYVSPLLRCRQTAEVLYPDSFTQVMEAFAEYDFGDFEGKTMEELKDNEDFRRWVTGGLQGTVPGGENGGEFMKRIILGIHDVFQDMMKQKVTSAAVITHGGVIMNLLSGVGVPKREPIDYAVGNGRGFTIVMTPQMWMRDRCFEVFDVVPKGERIGSNAGALDPFITLDE
ncbi:histidine phosphatase family protein [Zongyangia hominis]|uniref:Histidine phosphatase family protein n=1 Tax=Zongyangia hominis TaxID=2763677 RepID=A0A926EG20_9FIRM|nr:histidine phosphatase family protein [Zongyangia hominis]MBC8571032.1 histidine phosphatase family protein [Zongyangia hominis]